MMVTFISQCQKKSLKKTRRVLDSFADRIGDNTWQTIITEEGLQAVKKLLRKSASKNTAVSCHWIRSRSRCQFLWVVGNKKRFNFEGVIPVNYTENKVDKYMDNHQWKTLEVTKYAAAIAGLFHDFGKANLLFQKKLKKKTKSKGEPYRHEWISLRLFQNFAENKSDIEWLQELTKIKENSITECFRDGLDQSEAFDNPITKLSSFAQLVAWLILTHHRLPLAPAWKDDSYIPPFDDINSWIEKNFEPMWNSYQCKNSDKEVLDDNWNFKEKLAILSMKWRSHACIITLEALTKLKPLLLQETNWLHDQLFTTHLARLSLMLADHYYSSQEPTKEWRCSSYNAIANTYRKTKDLKQHLDEHLIGVAYNAKEIVLELPKLNHSLRQLDDNDFLINSCSKKLKGQFGWQDEARKLALSLSENTSQTGFFGINMASTGKGKTLGNAKIMYALGDKVGRKRFSIALGLRALTLQTGKEYRTKLKLNCEELAIAVGSIAVKQLFENTQDENETGSESEIEYLDPGLYVDYRGSVYQHSLSTWTAEEKNDRIEKLIQAPVLVCTIDHLVPATEGTKGGKQIGPMLRLLTSDLIIDEPDDFGLEDLPALCRLVHWAGVLGSRVLLSTATMPPALTYAAFQAYQAGWSEFAKANLDNWNGQITCAWFDEWESKSELCQHINDTKTFQPAHEYFIKKRIKNLSGQKIKRLGRIADVVNEEETVEKSMAKAIQNNILTLHKNHCDNNVEGKEGKKISLGLVRMANINRLVAVAKEVMALALPDDTNIHFCVYHSHYPLAIRSHIENKLDYILNRKEPNKIWETIKETINPQSSLRSLSQKNQIFIVVASPVAEVGRDHDYDWAIIEPSSMRSIIQTVGRVLRHREIIPKKENIVLLSKNYKALSEDKVCFDRPGFESKDLQLNSHDLNEILKDSQYEKIDASPRIKILGDIQHTKDQKYFNLNELEHKALHNQLFSGKNSAKVWWKNQPHWCGEVQRQQKFRKSKPDNAFYLWLQDEDSDIEWKWLNENVCPKKFGDGSCFVNIVEQPDVDITLGKGNHFWFDLRGNTVYGQLIEEFKNNGDEYDLKKISEHFGEIRLKEFNSNRQEEYNYHSCLGVYQEREKK